MAPKLPQLIAGAMKNAEENGYGDALRGMTLGQQAVDLMSYDAEIERDYFFPQVVRALIDYRINEKPMDIAKVLNRAQREGLPHRLLDPVKAIQFALRFEDGLEFLSMWNEGNWKGCYLFDSSWKDFK